MHFIRGDTDSAANHVAGVINQALRDGKQVLWLVSGGSSIDVAVRARRLLNPTTGLVVMQVDERYGPAGHADSNWRRLLDAGFEADGMECRPVLQGADFVRTAQEYNDALETAFSVADFAIGLFGIGTDGHTAGILPHSPAVTAKRLVAAYRGPDYERITITPAAITKLDEAVAYAHGKEKHEALRNLHVGLILVEQPAQALKRAKDAYVYNEYVEDTV